jgi:primosomal protein N' (replication factor Y)
MVAKGLDYPSVTLVGVVAADIGLHVADFRAAERTFDVITQVCGRSGRAGPGEAIVQTYAPEHPSIACAAAHDYRGFARQELAERRELDYPPFRRLAYLGVIGRDLPSVVRKSEEYANRLRDLRFAQVLGPAPYPVARVNREWRYRILIKTTNARALRDAIRERILVTARADRTTRVAVNIDP